MSATVASAAAAASSSSAAPLTVVPKPSSSSDVPPAPSMGKHDPAATEATGAGSSSTSPVPAPKEPLVSLEGAGQAVSSPAELMTFVDTMLAQLEATFNECSTEVLERMTTMSTRIDSLEMAIEDVINGEIMPTLVASGPGGGGGGSARTATAPAAVSS